MILAALDLMGSHKAAEDGFDQWVSLPMDPNSTGHHEWALPDRPNGLFSEGHGCLTHAVGPPAPAVTWMASMPLARAPSAGR